MRARRALAMTVALLIGLPAAVGSAAPGVAPDGARAAGPAGSAAGGAPAAREVTVMSRNLYIGASLDPIVQPPGGDVLAGVRAVWAQVQATDYPQRAEALADEIATRQPLLVGLQEVTTYRQGPPFDPAPAEVVVLDFLDVLLDELAARGTPYRALVSVENFDGELPHVQDFPNVTADDFDLRLTDRDVIIARADVPASQLQVVDTAAGTFGAATPLPIGGQLRPVLRGWVSADVRHRGKLFRFVNTHPEAFDDDVNAAQIAELLAGPLATALPVVLVGDLNATPGSASMAPLFAAGFEDTALTAADADAGPTCCFEATVDGGALTSRIDYVLYRGAFEATAQSRLGHLPDDRTAGGLYPSDHAGVVADLRLSPQLNVPAARGAARAGR